MVSRPQVDALGMAEVVKEPRHPNTIRPPTVASPRLTNHLGLRVGQRGGQPAAVFEGEEPSSSDQAIAAAAHQLGLGGILAPDAAGLGETLALFALNVSNQR